MADLKFQQLNTERVEDISTAERAVRNLRDVVRELQDELRKLEKRVEALE